MAMFFFFLTFMIAAPALCQTVGVVESSFDTGFDETLSEALYEAAIVLSVFATCSLLFRLFGIGQQKPAARRPVPRQDIKKTLPETSEKPHLLARSAAIARSAAAASSTPTFNHTKANDRASWRTCATATSPASASPPNRTGGMASSRMQTRAGTSDVLAQVVRCGRAADLPHLLDRLHAQNASGCSAVDQQEFATQQLLAALRACASARCFKEGLAAYEHVVNRIGPGQPALWSMLLYTSVEVGRYDLADDFFNKLCKHTVPSGHDFVNMVRCHVQQRDLAALRAMLADLHVKGCTVDAFATNKALAACAGADCALLEFAEVIAGGASLDAIGYNSLMKLHARAGRLQRILELRAEMAKKGLHASEVTFGILLDACVRAGDYDRAKSVFGELCGSGLRLNVVHCTTFIKGLIAAGRLGEADEVLDEMLETTGTKPDLITYSTLVKAHADHGNVSAALAILDKMMQHSIRPDEIIFNGVLSSCCVGPAEPAVTLRTFETLVSHGLQPSTMTLSILLKSLLLSGAWEVALAALQMAGVRFGMEPEARLYVQISQAGIKAHQGHVALEAYTAMLHATKQRGEQQDPSISARLLRQCSLSGDCDTALKLQDLARAAGISVELPCPPLASTRTVAAPSSRRGREVGQSVHAADRRL